MIPPVVDVAWLAEHPQAVIADVRWYLDGRSGAQAYAAGHIPGAIFIDLDAELAAPASPEAGRHPLPDPEKFASAMVEVSILTPRRVRIGLAAELTGPRSSMLVSGAIERSSSSVATTALGAVCLPRMRT